MATRGTPTPQQTEARRRSARRRRASSRGSGASSPRSTNALRRSTRRTSGPCSSERLQTRPPYTTACTTPYYCSTLLLHASPVLLPRGLHSTRFSRVRSPTTRWAAARSRALYTLGIQPRVQSHYGHPTRHFLPASIPPSSGRADLSDLPTYLLSNYSSTTLLLPSFRPTSHAGHYILDVQQSTFTPTLLRYCQNLLSRLHFFGTTLYQNLRACRRALNVETHQTPRTAKNSSANSAT
mmetsp:Transcript_25111/g.59862  ORF Transcript_25111/g.59862 Transcript_25111/m.59862 type:complete len:238 (+) Transcript_25111:651-1364(+)